MRKLALALPALVVVACVVFFGLAGARTEHARRPVPTVAVPAAVPAAPLVTPAPSDAISVYPAPGVRTASPNTQLSFRGATADQLGKIVVTGSRSGGHAGTLQAHSDGKGASFLPAKRFLAGEKVSVHTSLDIAGAEDGDFSITIALQAPQRAIRPQEPADKGNGAVEHFATRPDLVPPAVTVTTAKAGRAPGYVFLAPKGGRGQEGAMIVDDKGQLVWFEPMPKNRLATDLRVQTYEGRQVLTWWQGGLVVGDGRGYGVIADQSYRRVKTVRMGNGYSMDLHEFTITPQGTALAVAYNRVREDLRSLGGPRDAVVIDGVVQEIDVKTGLVLFEWHSIGSVGLDEGKVPLPKHDGGEYDYMHLNSVALDGDDAFIVSARNTWGVYKIDRSTAGLVWRLGGTKPTLKMGAGTATAWQHDAELQADGTLTLFDNGSSPPVHDASRALTLRVDEPAKTATLVKSIEHPGKVLSSTQGSVQRLPNGDTFVGYGSQPRFSEYDPEGGLVLDGRIAKGNDTYRVFRMPWEGRPATPPDAVATASGGKVTARVSWNGATGVARWQLLAGPNRAGLKPVADATARGFETTVTARTKQPVVTLRALDADGKTLGTTALVKPVSR